MGIFTLLDEDCLMPNATDKSFVEKLVANHKDSQIFKKPPRSNEYTFTIKHYAGVVIYNSTQWLQKNSDPLNENIVDLLKNSNDPFVKTLWQDSESKSNHMLTYSTSSNVHRYLTSKLFFILPSNLT